MGFTGFTMSRILKVLLLTVGLLNFSLPAVAVESWAVIMCNPAPMCIGDCRPIALVRPLLAAAPIGCSQMGTYPSYDFARRNADSFNGRPPAIGGLDNFDYYFTEGERYRALGDKLNAQKFYQNAASKASTMDEMLLVGEAMVAFGDVQAGISTLVRARDLSSRKVQLTMVGDAFKKAGRMDQAQICFDRARNASQ